MFNQRALYIAGAVALTTLAPLAAKAADMPQYTPPPVVTANPTWDWTGFYAGLNAGYGWSASNSVDMNYTNSSGFFTPCLASGACPRGTSFDRDGFVGGGQAGYNWQFNQWVLGLEADIDYSDMGGSESLVTNRPGFAVGRYLSSSEINWLGTLRGRAGFAVDRALFYATGGLAVGGVKDTFSWGFPSVSQVFAGSNSDTKWGWTVGGGVEFAVNDHFTLGGQVLYFDLGDTTVAGTPVGAFTPPAGTGLSGTFDHDGVVATVRANYKF